MATDTLSSISEWFRRAVPSPSHKNLSVQAGCHFEEMAEFADAVGNKWLADHLHECADELKGGRWELVADPVPTLDSLCDLIVTAIGVAHMSGWNIAAALAEVDRANWSKFVDGFPVFDNNGKIAKSENYIPPDLASFV